MSGPLQLRAIILGVEGVLVRLTDRSRHTRWEQRLGLAPGDLADDVLDSPSSLRACMGLCVDADVWMELGCLYRLHADEMAALAADFWSGLTVDVELQEFIQSLRPRLRVAGLSNAWPGARQRYKRDHELARTLDMLVLSAEEKLVRPDTRIYEVAIERLDIPPADVLYVDVLPQNVAGARDAGLQALHFVGTRQLIADLGHLLPLAAATNDLSEDPLRAQLIAS